MSSLKVIESLIGFGILLERSWKMPSIEILKPWMYWPAFHSGDDDGDSDDDGDGDEDDEW